MYDRDAHSQYQPHIPLGPMPRININDYIFLQPPQISLSPLIFQFNGSLWRAQKRKEEARTTFEGMKNAPSELLARHPENL